MITVTLVTVIILTTTTIIIIIIIIGKHQGNQIYRQLANSHVFVPVAIETAGTWNHLAVELTQKLGRRIIDDPRETGFLFLPLALQRGNAASSVALSRPNKRRCGHFASATVSSAYWLCADGLIIIIIIIIIIRTPCFCTIPSQSTVRTTSHSTVFNV